MTRRKKSDRRKAAGAWIFGKHPTDSMLIATAIGAIGLIAITALFIPINGSTLISTLIGDEEEAPGGSSSGGGILDDIIPGWRGGDVGALDEDDEEEDIGGGGGGAGDEEGEEEAEEEDGLPDPDPPEWFDCGGEVIGVLWVYEWYWQMCPSEWLGVAGQCNAGDTEIDIDIYVEGEYVDTVGNVRVGEIAELPVCCKWFCGILRITISQTDPHVVWICLQEEEGEL